MSRSHHIEGMFYMVSRALWVYFVGITWCCRLLGVTPCGTECCKKRVGLTSAHSARCAARRSSLHSNSEVEIEQDIEAVGGYISRLVRVHIYLYYIYNIYIYGYIYIYLFMFVRLLRFVAPTWFLGIDQRVLVKREKPVSWGCPGNEH